MKRPGQNRLTNYVLIILVLFLLQLNSCINSGNKGKLLENIGVCTKITNNTFLAEAGYKYVEESVQGFLIPLKSDSAFNQNLTLLKESKLPVPVLNLFIPGSLKCVGPNAVPDEILKYVEIALRRAEMAGVKIIVFGSGGSRAIPEGFSLEEAKEQLISISKKMAPIAEKYDVVIVLEPLNKGECNFINSLSEGAEIVEKVNHKNFMLLADIYHMLKENESPDYIVKYGDIIRHTHIAENEGRKSPGVHNEDFTPYFKALKKIKYKGMMSLECSWESMPEQAAQALQTLRNQLASI